MIKNARTPPVVPILIVIPFWQGDLAQATELLRLLADLQGSHAGQTAHVMLVNRKDCKLDPNLVKIISPKFNVLTYTSESNLKGWPAGPNGMFGTTMIRIANYHKGKYEVIYWMEPDSVPLHPNWHHDLVKVWRKRHPLAKVMGHRHDCNGDGSGDHCSGSCLYDPLIMKFMPKLASSIAAWDYEHRASIVRVCEHTHLIHNLYKARDVDPNTLETFLKQGVAVVHGIKCQSGINWVKQKYGFK